MIGFGIPFLVEDSNMSENVNFLRVVDALDTSKYFWLSYKLTSNVLALYLYWLT